MSAFAALKPYRFWKPVVVGAALGRVGILPFLLQAGQAAKTLTGYGIVLGPIMGMLTDAGWSVVQAARGKSVRVEGPPAADVVGKAVRYMFQAPYHAIFGQVFTFEEHMLLAAADAVAVEVIAQAFPSAPIAERVEAIEAQPVIEFEPWARETIDGLAAIGVAPGSPQAEPFAEVAPGATYGDVLKVISVGHGAWWQAIAAEFPRNTAATFFSMMVSDAGRKALEWLNGESGSIVPVFEPEEIAIARMFESGLFPRGAVFPELLGEYAQRALELSAAGGRSLPQRGDIETALAETFGGAVAR